MTLEASAISASTPLARSARVLLGTYGATVFIGAALLFFVQPMVSKMLLPHLGGGTVVGPLLMGLDRPVQIVNIGATVSDLVNLAALSAHDAIR